MVVTVAISALGSGYLILESGGSLGLWILFLLRVIMGWVFGGAWAIGDEFSRGLSISWMRGMGRSGAVGEELSVTVAEDDGESVGITSGGGVEFGNMESA